MPPRRSLGGHVPTPHPADVLLDRHLDDCASWLRAGRSAIADLLDRQRAEEERLARLERDLAELTAYARAALSEGRADVARAGAEAIAGFEAQAEACRDVVAQLDARAGALRALLDRIHRRRLALRWAAAGSASPDDLAARLRALPALDEAADAGMPEALPAPPRRDANDVLARLVREAGEGLA